MVDAGLAGEVVLVTGGTGSFGQAFVRRLLAEHAPAKVIVFSRDEQKHFALQSELSDPRLRFFVGDVRDRQRLLRAFEGVDVVVHAAAMKHVPLAEYNPQEAVRTNVEGASNVIDAALERGVGRVVALSTDKAVAPVNLYGATKLCMEKLFVAANSYAGGKGTRFDVVRNGNVVGSNGSVVPTFLRQRTQGELTVTDPAMTRFWVTLDRAVDLALLGLAEGRGGEVFVPRVPACSIATLAEAIAPGVPQRLVGMRPGEKLHETLLAADEARSARDRGDHFVIGPSFPWWGGEPRTDGLPLPADFRFGSDTAQQLGVTELRELLRGQGCSVKA